MSLTAAELYERYRKLFLSKGKDQPDREVSRVTCTDDKYEVRLDIQNFLREEISVKAVDRFIIVEGRHEESGKELGIISHQFTRRYVLPDGVLPENVNCVLGNDGILRLDAPRLPPNKPAKEVTIPIVQTEKDDSNSGQSVKKEQDLEKKKDVNEASSETSNNRENEEKKIVENSGQDDDDKEPESCSWDDSKSGMDSGVGSSKSTVNSEDSRNSSNSKAESHFGVFSASSIPEVMESEDCKAIK